MTDMGLANMSLNSFAHIDMWRNAEVLWALLPSDEQVCTYGQCCAGVIAVVHLISEHGDCLSASSWWHPC